MPCINHLAVPVDDVDRAAAFYKDWFEARAIAAPRFPVPVSWVLLDRVQIHLVQRPGQVSEAYHFAITIDDRERFEALYRRAEREGVVDRVTFRHHLYEATGGVVQLYINDPSGNVVECDYADVEDLDPEIAAMRWRWEDLDEQSTGTRRASVFTTEPLEAQDAR